MRKFLIVLMIPLMFACNNSNRKEKEENINPTAIPTQEKNENNLES